MPETNAAWTAWNNVKKLLAALEVERKKELDELVRELEERAQEPGSPEDYVQWVTDRDERKERYDEKERALKEAAEALEDRWKAEGRRKPVPLDKTIEQMSRKLERLDEELRAARGDRVRRGRGPRGGGTATSGQAEKPARR